MNTSVFRPSIHYYIYVLLLSLMSLVAPIYAQNGFHFNHLTTKDGLTDSSVWLIYQDSEGFIWLGTDDGAYRYDGYKVEIIRRNFLHSSGRGHSVTALAEDSVRKHMWMGTECGLFVWDERTDGLKAFEWPKAYRELAGKYISALCMDEKNRLYISVKEYGVYVLDTQKETVRPLTLALDIPLKYTRSIKRSNNNDLWIITNANCVVCYRPEDNSAKQYGGQLPYLLSFCKDKSGTLWFGTFEGLYKQEPQGGQPQPVNLLTTESESQLSVTDIVEYDEHTLVIASSDGLFFYDTWQQKAVHLKSDKRMVYTLNNDYLNALFLDREHTLWIATFFGGANYLPRGNRNFFTYDFLNFQMQGSVVSAFAEDRLGHVWIGTEDGGVACYNPLTQTVTNYNPKLSHQHVPSYYNIHALMADDDWLYIGMANGGVDRMNIVSGKIEHWKDGTRGSLSSNYIYSFGKSHDRRVWVGTTEGLDYFDPADGRIHNEPGVPAERVNSIMEDSLRNLWICGEKMGVWYKDTENTWHDFNKECPELATRKTYSLAQDGHTVFIGTEDYGVYCYDLDTGRLTQVSHPETDNHIVYGLVPENGYLWISTSSGLIHYHLKTKESKFYSAVQDLKTEQMNLNAGIRLRNGTLLFGSLGGLNGFRTADLFSNRQVPRTVLTKLYVNNSPVAVSEKDGLLTNTLTYTDHLTLNSDQSHVGFQFAVLSYSAASQNRFRYKLEPFDSDWREVDATNPVAYYTNLPAGDYTFKVIGANSDGVWSQKPCTLSVTVLPPWWFTWYMKTFYAFLVIAFVAYIFRRLKRKHQEEIELLNARQAKELYQTKMDFFTHLVHEIRTPLTLIMAPVELLLESMKAGKARDSLLLVRRNSRRLLNLVNQLMDMRKLDSQAFSLHPEACDLKDLLSKLCADFSIAARAKGIRIICRWDENTAARIWADKEALTKVFSNLLSNAMKFTRDVIEVSLGEESGQWIIAVKDNGPGIDKSVQQRIFEPFYQVKEQLPADYIGTGIGLTLVRKLVELCDGKVTIDSRAGAGCTFYVYLPQSTVVSEEEPLPEEEGKDEDLAVSAEGAGPSVAIVEDNEDMRGFLLSFLSSDFRTVGYADAKTALDELLQSPCDIVVSDVMMPDMDGFTFCKHLKENIATSHIPLVLLTAKNSSTDYVKGLDMGADVYLTKPFSPDVLKAQVSSLLKNRERVFSRYRENPMEHLVPPSGNNVDIEFLNRVNAVIEENMSNSDFSVQTMLRELGMSRTAFFLKIKAVSGMTFSDYVRTLRLKKAVQLFCEGNSYISEVSCLVGFSSPSYFCNCFKKQFHISPSEFIKGGRPEVR